MTAEPIEVRRVKPQETTTGAGWYYQPRIDVLEDADEILVIADLPGATRENVDVNFEDGRLQIHGRVEPRQAPEAAYMIQEYGVGDFERELLVGDIIDADKLAATMQNGVLTIHLPKSEKSKPRRIPVRGA
jgi:HSP20 family protein